VAENKGCAGVDGEAIAPIMPRADEVLATLIRQIHSGEYRSSPLRQLWILKKDWTWRGLWVATVHDRIGFISWDIRLSDRWSFKTKAKGKRKRKNTKE